MKIENRYAQSGMMHIRTVKFAETDLDWMVVLFLLPTSLTLAAALQLPILTNVSIKKPDSIERQNLASEEGDEKQ